MNKPKMTQFQGDIGTIDFTFDPNIQGAQVTIETVNIDAVLAMLSDNNGNHITLEQVQLLKALHVGGNPVFSPRNTYTSMAIAEMGSMIRSFGFDSAYSIITTGINAGNTDFTWINPSIIDEISMAKRIRDTETEVVARDDIGVCRDCGSKLVIRTIKQLCRADEPASVITECAKCSSRRIQLN